MIPLNGKYSSANMVLDDPLGRDKIMSYLDHPATKGSIISVMPNAGITISLHEYVIPSLIDSDVGCGVVAYFMGIKRPDLKIPDFDKMVRANVPMGAKRNKSIKHIEKYLVSVYTDTAKKIGMEELIMSHSIGTLGGKKHFIEIASDPEDNLWLIVHSGSRNFGARLIVYWQMLAQEICEKFFYNGKISFFPMNLGGSGYLTDMKIAQQYAVANRLAICEEIIGSSFKPVPDTTFLSSVHNYVSAEDIILRKSAISARTGEKCIVLFKEEGVAMCTGKGNKQWNQSAPNSTNFLEQLEPTVSVDFFLRTIYSIKAGGEER